MESAKQMFNVRPWNGKLLVGRCCFAARIASAMSSSASITSEWDPYHRWRLNYCRGRIGRPAKRWDDKCFFFFFFAKKNLLIMVSGGEL